MEKQYIWIATYSNNDGEFKPLKSSTSLLTLQDYVMKKAIKAVRYHSEVAECEIFRFRKRNTITFTIRYKGDPFSNFEAWTITRLEAI